MDVGAIESELPNFQKIRMEKEMNSEVIEHEKASSGDAAPGEKAGASGAGPKAPSHPKVVRLFVALELPGAIRTPLKRIMTPLIGVKWNPEHQIHLTLQFIGEVRRDMFEAIRSSLNQTGAQPFKLSLSSVGCFPPKGTPKVLWAGVSGGSSELLQLQESVGAALKEAGVKGDQRKYHPHVTLGRNKTASRKSVQAWLSEHQKFRSSEFKINRFALFSSVLQSGGAEHFKEADYPLGGTYAG